MSWREELVVQFGPGLFGGAKFGNWLKLLKANRFAVAPRCLIRATTITAVASFVSACGLYENWRYGAKVKKAEVKPPIFILGHWRSGTTHLQNLLCIDKRFAFPNFFQCLYPHTFLTTEKISTKLFGRFVPNKRQIDNVELSFEVPYEDEFATCVATQLSPYTSMAFPHQEEQNFRYMTLRDISPDELSRWRGALMDLLRKLTWKYDKPLILKSPAHTCRIRLLLEMFPDAKFVHIHRDPFSVFRSTKGLIAAWDRWHHLQKRDFNKLDDHVIHQYKEMYDLFFEERALIPEGQFHEISYEELDSDPLTQLQDIYEALELPDFSEVKPEMRAYLDQVSGYQKNSHPNIAPHLQQRISSEWRRSFEEWGYPTSLGEVVSPHHGAPNVSKKRNERRDVRDSVGASSQPSTQQK